jgi:hypothetical protein
VTGPTQPADDREIRKRIASLPALRMSPDGQRLAVFTDPPVATWYVVECHPEASGYCGYVNAAEVASWVAVAKSAVGEITEAHARNIALRDEHRREVEQLRAEIHDRPTRWAYEAACEALEKRRVALVGALGLPEGEGFYEAVKKVAALLSGGNATPADTAGQVDRVAKYLLGLQQAGGASSEEIDQFWTEGLKPFIRDLWRGRARVLLAESGWGSAVTTPDPAAERIDPRLLRWCEWPGCLRSFDATTGPDMKGWVYVRTGAQILLCPDHVNAGHRPQHHTWMQGDTTISTSCECGEQSEPLTPVNTARCTTWWREHIRALPAGAAVPAPADTEGPTRCLHVTFVSKWKHGDKALWKQADDDPGEPVEVMRIVGSTVLVSVAAGHTFTVDLDELTPPAPVAPTPSAGGADTEDEPWPLVDERGVEVGVDGRPLEPEDGRCSSPPAVSCADAGCPEHGEHDYDDEDEPASPAGGGE